MESEEEALSGDSLEGLSETQTALNMTMIRKVER
jgi:hypothetical protein